MRVLSTLLYFIVYRIVRYRRGVVRENLERSFPEKGERERRDIERRYYHHLCDLLVEGIHNLYAGRGSILRHYRIENREVVDRYYSQGKSVILLSQHHNNWEYMVSSLDMQFYHHGVGVGKPLDDKASAGYITRRRTRYGTEVVDQTNVREVMAYYEKYHVPCCYMMLSDQSPSNVHKSYWTMFLHQETPFLYGAEYFARKYNYPVIYYTVKKTRRFHYTVLLEVMSENPASTEQYAIERDYIRRLEQLLEQEPEYWLWSHKRWKRKRLPEIPLHESPKKSPTIV